MAQAKKRTPQVEELRPYVEGVAKNLVAKLYGPHGPAWGTKLTEIEADVLLDLRDVLTEKMLGPGAWPSRPPWPTRVSPPYRHCPGCHEPLLTATPPTRASCKREPAKRSMVRAGRLLRPLSAVFFSLSPRVWASISLKPARRCSRRSPTPARPVAPSPRPVPRCTTSPIWPWAASKSNASPNGSDAQEQQVAGCDAQVAAFQALPLVEKFRMPSGQTAPDAGGGHGRWRPLAVILNRNCRR